MKRKTYQLAQELEQRIFQLKLLKQYLETLLECSIFSVEIKTTILGNENFVSIPYINGHNDTLRLINDKNDKLFIINQIQRRIDDLQKQFNSL